MSSHRVVIRGGPGVLHTVELDGRELRGVKELSFESSVEWGTYVTIRLRAEVDVDAQADAVYVPGRPLVPPGEIILTNGETGTKAVGVDGAAPE